MSDLSQDTRDNLLVAVASGLSALLKAAGSEDDINASERAALRQMAAHTGTLVDAALEEMGL